ncbi:transglycosylase SLT domain-containing protein [Acetobacter musti]|uniref:Transglycosylase SLT domain-containing protein n=1 Tax=Acetobacter musti TaxID=864732 RepID=A0ABX0JSF3_9PROT|nr:lytic transglycosylase domain-containing protein [Acetobacter musti]NHN86222.1 transglycosylase SLT domain-containing protein [Acetobacter musti]
MPHVKKALGLLVVCGGFAIPVQTASAAPFDAYVSEAATRAHIPPAWITAVMRAESQGDAHAASPKGAMGLMQIMPDTWRERRASLNLGADPYDPRDNITAGAAYLRWLHDRYGDAGFLAAYNAGPGRYEQLLTAGKVLPDETRKYVTRVVRLLHEVSIRSVIPNTGRSTNSVSRLPDNTPSGSPLFVGPFASQTVVQNAPEVMPVSDHVMRFVAPPQDLFVSVSQRSAP